MYIDTHTHLYLEDFSPENSETVLRAIDRGVERLIFPNVDLTTIGPMRELHNEFPKNTFMAMGLHPTEVRETWQSDLETITEEFISHKSDYIAIGEIGIDLYWDKTFQSEQERVFIIQCELAVKYDLPIIIHCREGLDLIIDILSSLEHKPRGVFHCFNGTINDVKKIREVGDYYFGIGGVVTFKKSDLKTVLPEIGIDRILLETDSPYLAPVPHRGTRNESSYIPDIAGFISNQLSISIEQVAQATTKNAEALFRLTK